MKLFHRMMMLALILLLVCAGRLHTGEIPV